MVKALVLSFPALVVEQLLVLVAGCVLALGQLRVVVGVAPVEHPLVVVGPGDARELDPLQLHRGLLARGHRHELDGHLSPSLWGHTYFSEFHKSVCSFLIIFLSCPGRR